MKEYKVMLIKEGGIGTILLGVSSIPLKKLEQVLNEQAAERWEVSFQIIEQRRILLLWKRGTVILTLCRDKK